MKSEGRQYIGIVVEETRISTLNVVGIAIATLAVVSSFTPIFMKRLKLM